MDMRKTLPTMAKAALALLLAWGGAAQAEAQTSVQQHDIIAKQTYTDETTSDWKYMGQNGEVTVSTTTSKKTYETNDEPYGNFVKMVSTNTGSGTGCSYWKPTTFSDDNPPFNGYIDEQKSAKGYIIEFDFKINGATGRASKGRVTQLIVITGDKPSTTYKEASAYSGEDYLFALSNKKTSSNNSPDTEWHVNDFTYATTSAITLDKTKASGTTNRGWYHLKLTVTESSASYVLTLANGTAVTGGSGSKDISSLTSKTPTYIWALVGQSNGTLSFDNFHVYDYVENSSGDTHTVTTPTIAWKQTNAATESTAASIVYTITFGKGDNLYWKLTPDGQTATTVSYSEVNEKTEGVTSADDGKLSYDVSVTESGTLSAYSEYNGTKAEAVSQTPKIYSADISQVSSLCSFSSGNSVMVPDGVSIYIVTPAGNADDASSVSISKVEGTNVIPSSNGVFLYKAGGGTAQLPSVYSEKVEETAYNDNQLGGTGEDNLFLTPEASYMATNGYYFCLKKDAQAMGKVKEKTKIPIHKAYLKKLVTSAKLNIVFEDDATGIDGVRAFGDGQDAGAGSARNQGAPCNLAGQRVNGSYKGIVVRNGRKYVKR